MGQLGGGGGDGGAAVTLASDVIDGHTGLKGPELVSQLRCSSFLAFPIPFNSVASLFSGLSTSLHRLF